MRTNILLLVLIAGLLGSCRKDRESIAPQTGAPAADTSAQLPLHNDDRFTVRLRDINETGMPGPYFHFEWDSAGYATKLDFAAGFYRYSIDYSERRIDRMVNFFDGAQLKYHYTGGLVSFIRRSDSTGHPDWDYRLTYDAQRRLTRIDWVREPGASEILMRHAELSYGPDGNLAEWADYHRVNGAMTLLRTFRYSLYDAAQNVDDFYLNKTFFEDVLFLPGVRLQKNNALRVDIIGETNDFRIDYTMTLDNGLPVRKDGVMRQTRGNGTGNPHNLSTTYTYY